MKPICLLFIGASVFVTWAPSRAQSDSGPAKSQAVYTGSTEDAPAKIAPVTERPSAPVTNVLVSTNEPTSEAAPVVATGRVATLTPDDLKEFADQPPAIQALIVNGLELTRLNLKYQYGSDDPKNGGMDCSGTVYYLLTSAGLKDVPRDSGELYQWTWLHGHVEPVVSRNSKTFELDRLKPGDLLFWTGTYDIQRDPPITHVMIYLGINRHNGHRVMVGASEGREYDGKPRYGVSVFDFKLPGPARSKDGTGSGGDSTSRFIGYGSVPGL